MSWAQIVRFFSRKKEPLTGKDVEKLIEDVEQAAKDSAPDTSVAFAPVAENGKLWVDACDGKTKDMFKIYRTKEMAEANKQKGDVVKRVKLEVVQ